MQNCPCAGVARSAYAAFDVVAIAASLGGPEALAQLLALLPASFPADILVIQHVAPSSTWLRHRFDQVSPLPVRMVEGGELLEGGTVYLAPPDRHLFVDTEHRLQLGTGPMVKFCRPSAEPTFASVAGMYRERALGVVLTGCNTDGAMGVQMIKWMGGRVLVQDPATARATGMPKAAIATGAIDFVLPIQGIAAALVALVMAEGVAEYLKVGSAVA
jgi:two-component system, chemotaxis family, protein-glutamate methylesterase/glutaminase